MPTSSRYSSASVHSTTHMVSAPARSPAPDHPLWEPACRRSMATTIAPNRCTPHRQHRGRKPFGFDSRAGAFPYGPFAETTTPCSPQPHPWIDQGVGNIGQQQADDIEHGTEEYHGADDGEILGADGVNGVCAQPRDAEK